MKLCPKCGAVQSGYECPSATLPEKIAGYLSFAGTVATVIAVMILNAKGQSGFIIMLWALPLFALSAYAAFGLRVMWALNRVFLSIIVKNAYELEPSDLFLRTRRLAVYVLLIAGIITVFHMHAKIT